MITYLSSLIVNDVKKGKLNAVKRFLKSHANDKDALNACEKETWPLWFEGLYKQHGSSRDHLTHIAVRTNQLEILAALIACDGIDINLPNFDLVAPLTMAVLKNNLRAVNLLLAHPNIRVDIRNALDEVTPLILAAEIGSLPIVKTLLEHGADKNHTRINGCAAAQEALNSGHRNIADFISTYQSPVVSNQQPATLRPLSPY